MLFHLTTKFTIRFGTAITFTIVLPSRNLATSGLAFAAASISAGVAATGTVTAGSNCFGLGGISGCGFGAEEFTDNTAENVTITAGSNCHWIGGITGYAGGFENAAFGVPVTAFTRCNTRNVTITAGENADGIGEIVVAGFYSEQAAAMGEPFDKPTVYAITDCKAE